MSINIPQGESVHGYVVTPPLPFALDIDLTVLPLKDASVSLAFSSLAFSSPPASFPSPPSVITVQTSSPLSGFTSFTLRFPRLPLWSSQKSSKAFNRKDSKIFERTEIVTNRNLLCRETIQFQFRNDSEITLCSRAI
ncbi:hypothetical protein ACOSP7_022475 [Xanthoceras sorbifolium]